MLSKRYKSGVTLLFHNQKTYNLAAALLEKILMFPAVDEICVVDNCSGIDVDFDLGNSKIHYIKNDHNKGYSAGNNIGLRYLVEKCNCDFVFIANPDVDFENEAIRDCCEALYKYPKLALVSTRRYGYNGADIHQYFSFPTFVDSAKNCFFMFRHGKEKIKNINQAAEVEEAGDGILFVDAVPGAFFGMRSEFLIKNNYLYEEIFIYGEEIILGQQAYRLGYRGGVINTAIYYHNHIRSSFSNRSMFWKDRCSLIKYYKMFGLLGFWKLTLLRLFVLIGTVEYNCAYLVYKVIGKNRQ